MQGFELVLLLLLAVVVLATAAERVSVPYPVVLVLGGLALGFFPGLPEVTLAPDTVFLLFLPAILFAGAIGTDWRGFRSDIRPIFALAVILVLTTTAGVAAVAFAVMGHMGWSVAFVLGAIVSPPDAVSALAVVKRLGVPRRLVTILSGESLINDATALVTYNFAVAAFVTGAFSLWRAVLDFIYVAIVGVAVGLIVAVIVSWLITRVIESPAVGIAATLLTPIAAYLPAERIGASGVLAVVAAGLFFSRRTTYQLPAASRLQAATIWDFVTFLIDGLVFILIGLQLPTIIDDLEAWTWQELIRDALAVSAATIVIRVLWVMIATNPRRRPPLLQFAEPQLGRRAAIAMAWAGPRGIITLATALALPYTLDNGQPFPERDLVIFIAFCVILATLVGQGMTLPPLIQWLRFPHEASDRQELLLARREITAAALSRLDELADESWVSDGFLETTRARFEQRLARLPEEPADEPPDPDKLRAARRIVSELARTERATVRDLQREGVIHDGVRRTIEREIDADETRFTRAPY